jgi:hypothetical protein
LVRTKASEAVIERSTWLSAARWTTASGRNRAKAARIASASQMSARRNS